MSYSGRSRYDSPPYSSPRRYRSASRSFSGSRSRSRSRDSEDVQNPGNNLYVTGLSPRITKRDLEDHFLAEGKVVECHLVVDPRTRESRGFGFVTMATIEDADRCIKYLDRSVLEGRVITVEKAKRRRGRTPTPGKYLGVRPTRVRDYDRRRGYSRIADSFSSRRSPSYSPYRGDRRYGERRHGRDRSVSPYSSRRDRSLSPYYERDRYRSLTPYGRRERSESPYTRRERSRSLSPYGRRERSLSPGGSPYRRSRRSYSYRSRNRSRSRSRSLSPY